MSHIVFSAVTWLSYQHWSRHHHHIVRMDQCLYLSWVTALYTMYDTNTTLGADSYN